VDKRPPSGRRGDKQLLLGTTSTVQPPILTHSPGVVEINRAGGLAALSAAFCRHRYGCREGAGAGARQDLGDGVMVRLSKRRVRGQLEGHAAAKTTPRDARKPRQHPSPGAGATALMGCDKRPPWQGAMGGAWPPPRTRKGGSAPAALQGTFGSCNSNVARVRSWGPKGLPQVQHPMRFKQVAWREACYVCRGLFCDAPQPARRHCQRHPIVETACRRRHCQWQWTVTRALHTHRPPAPTPPPQRRTLVPSDPDRKHTATLQ
jgi:hypothetical protein